MITKDNFGEDHIREIQKRSHRDPQLIERMLYAFGLLEALAQTGLDFTFKGGSSLMLLLPHPMRLSTDIDIVVPPETDIMHYIDEASKIFPFIGMEEQHRKGKNDIEKRHFKFTYPSPIRGADFYILLDVLFEHSNYAAIEEHEIAGDLILTEGKNLLVNLPSADCILGDKLTAFAPHTTGIPLRANKDMEVIKQYYDICSLIDVHSDFNHVKDSFLAVAASEIGYRGVTITPEDVLKDSIASALVIASRGKIGSEDYPVYVEGIRAASTHIYAENYSPEIASYRAAKLIYMSACLLTDVPFQLIDDYREYADEGLTQEDIMVLRKMRKARPLEYAYLVKADQLLKEYRR